MKRLIVIILIIALVLSLCPLYKNASAATLKLNRKSVTVTKGKSITLKMKNAKKKVKWSVKTGKKYIRLKAKKRRSVKVVGLKKGTAKVQGRVGKKSLFCKVKVKQNTSWGRRGKEVEEDLQIEPVPTAIPCPTHEPTEDCLMAEPAVCETLPIENEEGFPIWYPTGNTIYYFFGTEISRKGLSINITTTNEVPQDAKWSKDVSEKQNGSVMAWIYDMNGDGRDEMNIGQKGGVVANLDSSYLFCDIAKVTGLENLYTTYVTNMSHMFYRYAEFDAKVIDLGNQFDTSNVENMYHMFAFCGYRTAKEIHLGKYFDTSKVTNSILMFMGWEAYQTKYYVPNVKVKNWLLDREHNHTFLNEGNYDVIIEP